MYDSSELIGFEINGLELHIGNRFKLLVVGQKREVRWENYKS